MICGATDYACRISTWLDQYAPGLLDLLTDAADALRPHLPWLVALASFSVTIVKWLQSRDSVTFKRLAEIIGEDDARLWQCRYEVLQTYTRPGPDRMGTNAPLYAVRPLRHVLQQRRWIPAFTFGSALKRAERRLDKALAKLQEQIEWTEKRQRSLRRQLAAAHLLKGAVASAQTANLTTPHSTQLELNRAALSDFTAALAVPGNEKDIAAVEHKGHQFHKLNLLPAAQEQFREMERLAAALASSRHTNLLIARAKKFQAEVLQVGNPASPVANQVLIAAVERLQPLAPLTGRDLLDQAEIHEMHGAVRLEMLANDKAPVSIAAARSDYESLLASLGNPGPLGKAWEWFRRLFRDDGTGELRRLARRGLARVEKLEAAADALYAGNGTDGDPNSVGNGSP